MRAARLLGEENWEGREEGKEDQEEREEARYTSRSKSDDVKEKRYIE